MPLLTKMLPLRETVEDLQATSLHSSQHQLQETSLREEKDQDSGYDEEFQEFDAEDDECLDSDMEGSIVHRGRPKKVVRAPAIPVRNEKRASKILENVMLELKTLDGTTSKDTDSRSMIQESDPHESYLSSEEDASLSDDYDDTDSLSGMASPSTDADAETPSEEARESFSRRRKSQEDTARVVSFIMVGKPQIVDIFIPSNHVSPVEGNLASIMPKRHSMNLDVLTSLTQSSSSPARSTRRPIPLKLYPNSIRRMSISSITSSHTSNSNSSISASTSNLASHPPRKSSRLALNLNSLVTSTRNTLQTSFSASSATPSHSFLNSDPFSKPSEEKIDEPTTPKTPTSMAAAAWKRGLGKTLNKARRPSIPKLSMAYGNSSVNNLSSTNASPEKSWASRRISTAHSNYSSNTLGRMISESTPETQEAGAPSRTSVSSNPSPQQETTSQSEPQPPLQPSPLKRAETTQALTSSTTSTSYIPPSPAPIRYEDVMKGVIRGPPPIPSSESEKVGGSGRRSFSFAVGMGLGRRKSVKAK